METWLAVPGYEGLYEVSDCGNVRRLAGAFRLKPDPLVFKPQTSKQGYLYVRLWRGGRGKFHLIHRLVLAAFVGPCPEGHNVNHRDGVKAHNVLANLEYVTFSANTRHAMETGLLNQSEKLRGERSSSAKITEETAIKIKAHLAEARLTAPAIASLFHGATAQIVHQIKQGRTWRHLP